MLITVGTEASPSRLDRFVSEKTGISRSQVSRLIEKSLIKVNNAPVRGGYRLRAADTIEVTLHPPEVQSLLPEEIPLEVFYSDREIVVVNKPPGMVVYPAAGHPGGTLMNALRFRFGDMASIGGPLRPGVVHRLDKDTSGVMVVALSDRAYYPLSEQFRERTVGRSYLALVYGGLKTREGEITLNIGRSESDRKKMSTKSRRGKEARTSWETVERLEGATLVRARLLTGRTHQIRVHFASLGHPLLGDATYGGKRSVVLKTRRVVFPRQMLHAEFLCFDHPLTGERLEFSAPVHGDMSKAIGEIRGL